jgi:hypothetical protein
VADPTIDRAYCWSAVNLAAFLTLIARTLKEAEIPFMLTGSLAAAFYGAPRATQDVDFIIESGPEKLQRLVDNLEAAGLCVDVESAAEALHTGANSMRSTHRLAGKPI